MTPKHPEIGPLISAWPPTHAKIGPPISGSDPPSRDPDPPIPRSGPPRCHEIRVMSWNGVKIWAWNCMHKTCISQHALKCIRHATVINTCEETCISTGCKMGSKHDPKMDTPPDQLPIRGMRSWDITPKCTHSDTLKVPLWVQPMVVIFGVVKYKPCSSNECMKCTISTCWKRHKKGVPKHDPKMHEIRGSQDLTTPDPPEIRPQPRNLRIPGSRDRTDHEIITTSQNMRCHEITWHDMTWHDMTTLQQHVQTHDMYITCITCNNR